MKRRNCILAWLIVLCSALSFCGCGDAGGDGDYAASEISYAAEAEAGGGAGTANDIPDGRDPEGEETGNGETGEETAAGKERKTAGTEDGGGMLPAGGIQPDSIPAYSGKAYATINGNVPYFDSSELTAVSYESYSGLDSLGRCGACTACIGQDLMPTEERGAIGSVKPTGWQTVKYSGVIDGNYLYNRCHLIGYQLTGENANERNLITGTRYLNVDGMLPFEDMVADFVKETGIHVLYRVTPVFEGDNLVADGVLMEAESVEDKGEGILYCVYCYNVQPGITINYADGSSSLDGDAGTAETSGKNTPASGALAAETEGASGEDAVASDVPAAAETPEESGAKDSAAGTAEKTGTGESTAEAAPQESVASGGGGGAYAVNGNNGKIHITGGCPATGTGKNAMKNPVYFGTYEEAESYSVQIAPGEENRKCGNCW